MSRARLNLCPCPLCRGHNVQQRGWRRAEVGPVQLAGAGQGGLVGRRSASAGGGADCAAEGRPQHHPHCQAHTPHRQRARELMTSEMMKRHFDLTHDEDDVFLDGCCLLAALGHIEHPLTHSLFLAHTSLGSWSDMVHGYSVLISLLDLSHRTCHIPSCPVLQPKHAAIVLDLHFICRASIPLPASCFLPHRHIILSHL